MLRGSRDAQQDPRKKRRLRPILLTCVYAPETLRRIERGSRPCRHADTIQGRWSETLSVSGTSVAAQAARVTSTYWIINDVSLILLHELTAASEFTC